MSDAILEVEGYSGAFRSREVDTWEPVLFDVSYKLRSNAITAVVGETGSGKSLMALSILGLQPPTFQSTAGSIRFKGEELRGLDDRALRRVRGKRISMVFQDARAALNPVFTVGDQLAHTDMLHSGRSRSASRAKAIDALRRVRIPEPERRARQYPHEYSGGMAQRAMIAMAALICEPELLIMDEPTTGLDVTTQAEIMDLILDLARSRGLTVCLITHDLGVVAETCDEVIVMNKGRVVETGTTEQIFTAPAHAYTRKLLSASQIGNQGT